MHFSAGLFANQHGACGRGFRTAEQKRQGRQLVNAGLHRGKIKPFENRNPGAEKFPVRFRFAVRRADALRVGSDQQKAGLCKRKGGALRKKRRSVPFEQNALFRFRRETVDVRAGDDAGRFHNGARADAAATGRFCRSMSPPSMK